ncbi:MAG TPA: hypothetical protein VHA56_15065 [Mucilaginibacter sp.]|nr:hypothetical protein [Mucilaginibacter sp.]
MNTLKRIIGISFLSFWAGVIFAQNNVYNDLVKSADSSYTQADWKNAAETYRKAVADTSTNAGLWQRLGTSELMTGDDDDALESFKKGLLYKPTFYQRSQIQRGILNIYDRKNDFKDALAFLSHAVDNGFSNFPMFDTLKIFKANGNSPEYRAVLDKARINAYPCMAEPHNKDFNFWVGEWDVYQTGTHVLVGRSSITKSDGECTILENFQSLIPPQSGHSINYFDQTSKTWEQIYSGSGGAHQLYDQGEYKDGRMAFHYKSSAKGQKFDGHFFFYNLDADTVRQVQDYTTDGGKTYQTSYDLTYIRRKAEK